jgi:branched-chain amino acid transport system permease protein
MNAQIALLLGQDGVTNGAIYALLALSIVLVFTVTRVLLVPQGEFVTFGAMTMATLQAGQPVRLAWLLLALALLPGLAAVVAAAGSARRSSAPAVGLGSRRAGVCAGHRGHCLRLPGQDWPMALQVLFTLAIVVPMGPDVRPVLPADRRGAWAGAADRLHRAARGAGGAGLWMFGAEGARTQPFSEDGLDLGLLNVNAQSLWVLATTLVLIVGLFVFFERTLRARPCGPPRSTGWGRS